MDVVSREPHRQQVEATPAGRRVEQGDGMGWELAARDGDGLMASDLVPFATSDHLP